MNDVINSILQTFVAIDFETANHIPSSVCSVGIVVVEEEKIVDKIYSLIRPRPNFYNYWNTQIHGLTEKDTAFAPYFPEIWNTIAPKISGLPLVAHNSRFDEGCLKAVFSIYEIPYPNYLFHCTCRLSRKLFRALPNHQLHTVSAHCGFDLKNHHHALADAEACTRIMIEMSNRKKQYL